MNSNAKKLKNAGGFTFTEVLVAVLILVMITAGLMPAALHAYQNAVDAANAHVLLTETVNALRSELSTAWDVVDPNGSTVIVYQSARNGGQSKISLNADNVIMLQEYDEYGSFATKIFDSNATVTTAAQERSLVSEALKLQTGRGKDPMIVTYTSAKYDKEKGYITITGLEVRRSSSESAIAKMPENGLIIRTLGGEKP